jgi:hypothetical protein
MVGQKEVLVGICHSRCESRSPRLDLEGNASKVLCKRYAVLSCGESSDSVQSEMLLMESVAEYQIREVDTWSSFSGGDADAMFSLRLSDNEAPT